LEGIYEGKRGCQPNLSALKRPKGQNEAYKNVCWKGGRKKVVPSEGEETWSKLFPDCQRGMPLLSEKVWGGEVV